MPNTTRKLPRSRPRNNRTRSVSYKSPHSNSLIHPGIALNGGACIIKAEENSFNHPTQVEQWFYDERNEEESKKNRYNFIFGLGVILKYKEELMDGKIKSILKEIDKNNDEYTQNEENYEKLMGEAQQRSTSDMKEKLQETVRENLNKAYENKFSELLVKKQSYDVVLECIRNRRWYIVAALQKDGGKTDIFNKIIDAAKEIYSFYRGPKYTHILGELYQMIKIISQVPSSLQDSFSLNTSIVGPAGSGKTTMARQIAKWYAYLGIMTYDAFFEDPEKLSFTETGRSGLIGEYTGQTAPKTLGVLVKSLEKTLFIDEAYSVAGCAFDKDDKLEPDPYGEEFLATMLTFMNDHKGFSALIVAGYENFMRKCFFDRNEGLPRRFPRSITLPFYATDELFGIFMKNVMKKCLDGIHEAKKPLESTWRKAIKAYEEAGGEKAVRAGDKMAIDADIHLTKVAYPAYEKLNEKYKSIAYYHFRYLTVMKPSFMMIHGDTSFHGIDILRKYLLAIQLRLQLTSDVDGLSSIDNLDKGRLPSSVRSNPEPSSNVDKSSKIRLEYVYSYTILAQVLINLFDSDSKSARKQLFRRMFYSKVFNFEKANMSFFPAQAGEMDNLSDECVRSIGSEITADMENKIVVGVCKETEVINNYCLSKKIKVQLFKPRTQVEENKYYMELHMTNIEMADVQERIKRFFELDKLFNDCIPSLTDLYVMLADPVKIERLTKHIIYLYLKKVDGDYLDDLNNLGEKEFPIHITKIALETEIETLRNINAYKPNKEFFEKEEFGKNINSIKVQIEQVESLKNDEKFKELKKDATEDEDKLVKELVEINKAKCAKLLPFKAIDLANPAFTKLNASGLNETARAIMISDMLYEDLGYSEKIFRDDEDLENEYKNTLDAKYHFSIRFLDGLTNKIFFGRSKPVDLEKIDGTCNSLKDMLVETKSENTFLMKAQSEKTKAKPSARLERIKEEELARLKAKHSVPVGATAPELPV